MRFPARVLPPSGPFYSFLGSEQLFTVTIRAGYEPSDTFPQDLCSATLILLTAFDQDRAGGDLFQKAEATARMICADLRQWS